MFFRSSHTNKVEECFSKIEDALQRCLATTPEFITDPDFMSDNKKLRDFLAENNNKLTIGKLSQSLQIRQVAEVSSSTIEQCQIAKWIISVLLAQDIQKIKDSIKHEGLDKSAGLEQLQAVIKLAKTHNNHVHLLIMGSKPSSHFNSFVKMLNQFEKVCSDAITYVKAHPQSPSAKKEWHKPKHERRPGAIEEDEKRKLKRGLN
ncbi:MAG: hypothetical protein ABI370_05195 [Gammaproteobacteria bacterium]